MHPLNKSRKGIGAEQKQIRGERIPLPKAPSWRHKTPRTSINKKRILDRGCINVGVDQLNTDRPQSRLLCSDADCSSVVRPPLGVQPVARAPHRRPRPHYVLRVRRGAPAREKRRREDDCLSDRVSDTGHGGERDWYGKLRLVVPNMTVLLYFQDKLREGRIEQKKDFWVRRRSSNSGHGGGHGWCW
ncbi:hypothetical protein ACLB2K_003139 [Fragaria x ananassa]